VRLRLAAGDGLSRIARAVPAGADHQASRKVNKLATALRKCAPDEHACCQESNPDGVPVRGIESQKHPRHFPWSVGIPSAWIEDLIYN